MKLIDFYKRVVHSLGLHVSKDNYIQVEINGNKSMLTDNGIPLVLPTKEHIDSSVDKDENGDLKLVKLPYNPLNEDVIKGDSISLKKTKTIIERKIAHSFAAVGELLLTLTEDPKLQKDTDLELNKFLSSLNNAEVGKIKALVDDKSIDLWGKIYSRSLEIDPSNGFTKMYLKKKGRYGGEIYNRLAVMSLPIYEQLVEATRDTPIFGITLRKKDIGVFKIIHEYVFKDMDENQTITIGSKDPESPGFVALFKLYIKVANRLNKILKSLEFVNKELVHEATFRVDLTLKELDNLDVYKSELVLLPSELELNRQKAVAASSVMQQQAIPANTNTNQSIIQQQAMANPQQQVMVNPQQQVMANPQQPVQQQMVQQPMQQPVQQPVQQTNETNSASIVHKLLYGNTQQPQVIPQYGAVQPPQPMMQQPMVQQPMVQQPMYGVPQQGSIGAMQQNMGINPPVQQQQYGIQQPIQGYQPPVYGR